MRAREERIETLHSGDSSPGIGARRLRSAVSAAVAALSLGLLLLPAPAGAEEDEASAPAEEGAPAIGLQPRPFRSWDAAIGFIAAYGPEYLGSDQRSAGIAPGFALRWGRFSYTSRSAFAVRTSDPAATPGLRVEVPGTGRLRIGLGLRYDRGRDESGNDAYKGLGDIPGGVMLRVNPRYPLADGWTVGGSVTFPLVGRGPGARGEFTVGRDLRLGPRTTFGAGTSLAFGSHRYMQAYYGVTDDQSQTSGYPVYRATMGPFALAASAGWRTDLGESWVLMYGLGASVLLGSAVESPLTKRRASWSLNSGVVYHF